MATSTLNPRSPVLQTALEKGESVRWCTQPRLRLFGFQDLLIVPFMSVWCFGVFGFLINAVNQSLTKQGGGLVFNLFIASTMASIGLYMLVGRFIHTYLVCRARFYMVTNKRAIVYSSFWTKSIQSIPLEEIQTLWIWPEGKESTRGFMSFGELSLPQPVELLISSRSGPSKNKMIFSDLEDLPSAIKAVQTACSGRELKIEDLSKVLSSMRWSIVKGDGSQVSMNNFREAAIAQMPSLLALQPAAPSNLDKEQLTQRHKRIYIWRSIGLLFGAAAALCFGASQLFTYQRDFKSATECKTWPVEHGRISELSMTRKKRTTHLRSFRVDFSVDGKAHTCKRYSLRMGNEEERQDELAFAKAHSVGDAADVYYDPADPDVSVISPASDLAAIAGRKSSGLGAQVIGLLFILGAAYRLIIGSRQSFTAKPLTNDNLLVAFYVSAFLSLWFAMLFCFILAPTIGALLPATSL